MFGRTQLSTGIPGRLWLTMEMAELYPGAWDCTYLRQHISPANTECHLRQAPEAVPCQGLDAGLGEGLPSPTVVWRAYNVLAHSTT